MKNLGGILLNETTKEKKTSKFMKRHSSAISNELSDEAERLKGISNAMEERMAVFKI